METNKILFLLKKNNEIDAYSAHDWVHPLKVLQQGSLKLELRY